jgi:phage terminase Nu1 subunit (DNA packaging protein)
MPVMLNPIQERARKDKELADKASLENQVRRGELVEASIVGSKWKEIMLRVRSRMMRIPWASAPLLVGEEDQIKIQMTIEDQIRDALTELSAD